MQLEGWLSSKRSAGRPWVLQWTSALLYFMGSGLLRVCGCFHKHIIPRSADRFLVFLIMKSVILLKVWISPLVISSATLQTRCNRVFLRPFLTIRVDFYATGGLTMVWLTTFSEVKADPLGAIWMRPLDYREITKGTLYDPSRPRTGAYRRDPVREGLVAAELKKLSLFND